MAEAEVFYRPGKRAREEGRSLFAGLWRSHVRRMVLTNVPALGAIMAIYSSDLTPVLHVVLLVLIGVNAAVIPVTMVISRMNYFMTHISPTEFSVREDGVMVKSFLFRESEVSKVILEPITEGLALFMDVSVKRGEVKKSGRASMIILGLNEADIAPIRRAMEKAGFTSEVKLGVKDKWRSGHGYTTRLLNIHFTILLAVIAVVAVKLLMYAGLIMPVEDPSIVTLAMNTVGVAIVVGVSAVHIPDRISQARGRAVAGSIKSAYTRRASCQIHWGDAIAMDAMDEAGLLYERKVDRSYGTVEPRRYILLVGIKDPNIALLIRQNDVGGTSFTVGTASGRNDFKVRRRLLAMKEDMDGCLRSLEASVADRKKGEMIDFR